MDETTEEKRSEVTLEEIVGLCKRRGFIFPSSEIYGGVGSTYDYGHYGVLLRNNVKNAWWRAMLTERDDIVALDSAIIQHPRVWADVSGETSKDARNSYVDFAKGARVAVVHCPNFNTHVIKDDAAKLLQCLRKHDYKVEKYPEPEDEITDIEEDDTTDPNPETPNARSLEPELDTP